MFKDTTATEAKASPLAATAKPVTEDEWNGHIRTVGGGPAHFPREPGTAGGFVPSRRRDPKIAEPHRGIGRDHAETRPNAVGCSNHHGIGGKERKH